MFRIVALSPLLIAVILTGCGGTKGSSTTIVINNSAPAHINPARVYRVPSGSMEPTYRIGSRVIVQEGTPRMGAVVTFHPPKNAEQEVCGPTPHVVKVGGAACAEPEPEQDSNVSFIKRIVAGPGDEIYIREGHVYRKAAGKTQFAREDDSYIRACGASPECNFPVPIKVPADEWYLMGDNRGESDDSRFWGPVPASWIVGVVTGTE
jgi:signal peptidase I